LYYSLCMLLNYMVLTVARYSLANYLHYSQWAYNIVNNYKAIHYVISSFDQTKIGHIYCFLLMLCPKVQIHNQNLSNKWEVLYSRDVSIGGRGGVAPQYFWICKKVGQKAAMLQEEFATVFSVTFFKVTIVGQLVNTPSNRRCLGRELHLRNRGRFSMVPK